MEVEEAGKQRYVNSLLTRLTDKAEFHPLPFDAAMLMIA